MYQWLQRFLSFLEGKSLVPRCEAWGSGCAYVLSQEKTKITHINEGFDFLGVNIRKYNGKLIIKPAKDNVKRFLENIRETVKSNKAATTENLIRQLNPKLIGWANYHRHNCSKRTFSNVSDRIFNSTLAIFPFNIFLRLCMYYCLPESIE